MSDVKGIFYIRGYCKDGFRQNIYKNCSRNLIEESRESPKFPDCFEQFTATTA
jgi:hypothetical protein